MQFSRRRFRVGPRLSTLPAIILAVLAAVAAGTLYVAARMLMAPRPAIALAGPFDVVGRGATLALDARDASGLRSLKVTIRQGDREQTIVDEKFLAPLPEVHREWRPAKETRFRLEEGPGVVHVEARNASWGNFFRG